MIAKLILIVAGLLGLGAWQLHDVNRELRKSSDDEGHRQENSDKSASGP